MNRTTQIPESFLPDFCSARTLFVLILLAELLAITLSMARPPYAGDHLVDLAMNSLFIQWVTLSCTAILCLFRGQFQKYNDHWVAAISYGITLLVTLLIAELTWQILAKGPTAYDYSGYGHADFILRIIGISAIVWALALRYFYVQHQWRIRIRSESEARYQALQSRIKPHFLFNCMNTIAGLIRRKPALAEEAIEDLADLFRASLQDAQKPWSLQDELALCKRYLRIEQHRLGERLEVVWQITGIPGHISLPVLSLQPLLENAIYHGIEPSPAGGKVYLDAFVAEDIITITIENPVSHPRTSGKQRTGNHFAQENVAQRLASWFGKEGLLQVREDEHHYKVTVTIPYTT